VSQVGHLVYRRESTLPAKRQIFLAKEPNLLKREQNLLVKQSNLLDKEPNLFEFAKAPNLFAKEQNRFTNEPYLLSKEPYVLAKMPNLFAKEQNLFTKEPSLLDKEQNVCAKEPNLFVIGPCISPRNVSLTKSQMINWPRKPITCPRDQWRREHFLYKHSRAKLAICNSKYSIRAVQKSSCQIYTMAKEPMAN
jgi:hypothetical protein